LIRNRINDLQVILQNIYSHNLLGFINLRELKCGALMNTQQNLSTNIHL